MDLGLGYLSLDRAASTLSTGERQRVQLARAVRNRTTGVLYVLDEPSIGLHPYNLKGLTGVMDDLAADGNTVVLVGHDTQVLSHADWMIEMGPEAGAKGGTVIAQGTIEDIINQGDQRYMNIYACEEDGPFLVRAKFRKNQEDNTWTANKLVYKADDAAVEFYRTKAAQSRRRGRGHKRKIRPAK